MNIGMTLPVMEPGLTRNNLYEWTNQIDKGPWSSNALGERIVFDNPEFISMLSAVAAWTSNVEIISTVSVLSMHDPVLSAKQFATIDMLSEGRLTVGVGVGGRQEDYEAIGSDWKNHRWKKVSEYSKIMQSIWASEFAQDIGPKPVQAKGPKILAGAIGNMIDSIFYGVFFTDSYGQVAEIFPQKGYAPLLFGHVVDMLQFPLFTWVWPNWLPWLGGSEYTFFQYVFNPRQRLFSRYLYKNIFLIFISDS